MHQVNPQTQTDISRIQQRELQRLREVTGEVVGQTFFATLLRTMRESPLKGMYGHGGRGEEVFAAQLHGVFAERMGKAMKNGPGEAIYNMLAKQQRLMSAMREESANDLEPMP